jgi:hypothetical protein
VATLALGVLAAALVKLAGDSGSSGPAATTTVTGTAPAGAPSASSAPATSTPGAATTPTASTSPTVTAQPGNAGGIAGPSSTPTVTAKTGIGAIPGLTKAQRKQLEGLSKARTSPNTAR